MEELMRSKNLGFNTFSPDERLDDRISFAVLQQHLHGRILHILPAELFFRLLWMLSELREKCRPEPTDHRIAGFAFLEPCTEPGRSVCRGSSGPGAPASGALQSDP